MNRENLERVEGISRFYEMLWIERDADRRIASVYDRENRQLPHTALHRSFITGACPGGFIYKGVLIPSEN
jgi:hypothetical protein